MGSLGTTGEDTGKDSIHRCKILVVGSGGNGLSCAVSFKRAGEDDLRIISRHGDFGGAWWQNRYPGCYSDAPVLVYQLEFAQKTNWPENYGSRAEMAAYFQSVAAENDIYRHTDFNTELLEAEWLDNDALWKVHTNNGIYLTQFLITATGYLDQNVIPDIPGMNSFKGRQFHSSQWPDNYVGTGERIAVVGTAASGVQIIPELQKVAAKVVVLQRTAGWVLPAHKEIVSAEEQAELENNPQVLKEKREKIQSEIDTVWDNTFLGLNPKTGEERQKEALDFLESQVPEPELRALLTPDKPVGVLRPCMHDSYFASLRNPNVDLVPEALAKITDHTVITPSGREFEVDTIVFATGFLLYGDILHRIKRRDGVSVGKYQKGHPRAYKAISVAQCPNLFLIGGSAPNSMAWDGYLAGKIYPGYVLKAIQYMEANRIRAMEVDEGAELTWKKWADDFLKTAPMMKYDRNYVIDQTGHNMGFWPGGRLEYTSSLSEFDPSAYHAIVRE